MEANLAGLLTTACVQEPDKHAVGEAASGRTVTWLQLDELVDRVAQGLFDVGLVSGLRVALLARNRIETVAGYLGVLRAGMVAVPLDPEIEAEDLAEALGESGARLLVCDAASAPRARTALTRLAGRTAAVPRVVVVGGEAGPEELAWADLVARRGATVPLRADPESLAVLLRTSSSTGRPRAAMLTHRALLANVEQLATAEEPMVEPGDVVLGALPLHHAYGLCVVLGQVLRQHSRLVLVEPVGAEEALDIVEDEAVSVAPVTPGMVEDWLGASGLEERVGSLRLVISGSAPLAPETATVFARRTGLRVHQGYALTECGPVVSTTLACAESRTPSGADARAEAERTVGRPLPGVEIRLVDELDRAPEPGDPGQILVRGPQLFSGYWPDGARAPDEAGWWSTGDVGILDAGGELHLVDRVRDLVQVAGFNVFPMEVESVVVELAAVATAAVVGLEDAEGVTTVACFVTPADPVADPVSLREQVLAHCAARLAGFKVPTLVEVVDELPRTSTGKVNKGQLRTAARSVQDAQIAQQLS